MHCPSPLHIPYSGLLIIPLTIMPVNCGQIPEPNFLHVSLIDTVIDFDAKPTASSGIARIRQVLLQPEKPLQSFRKPSTGAGDDCFVAEALLWQHSTEDYCYNTCAIVTNTLYSSTYTNGTARALRVLLKPRVSSKLRRRSGTLSSSD